ncbi:MAG: DNA cytosine methyltransferase [Bacteroidales bacterium]|nr:DNA cytosine methyltransferase [Bacteroidales bacterium]
MAKKKFAFIDLFAGCGGLSEGFLQTGRFKALAHVEWEKPMVDTLRNRLISKWEESKTDALKKVILFDIQKTEELIYGLWSDESNQKYGKYNSDIVKTKGLKGIVGNKHVDLIIGGPPCQAYSIHGRATDKNSMQNDYRNYLFESFCKVVDAFRPEIFVFENVGGLLSAKPGGIPVRNRIYNAFTEIGYVIRAPKDMPMALFDAENFGVPQHRPRVIIIGVRNDSKFTLDELYTAIKNEQSPNLHLTVRDAIGKLPAIYPLAEPQKEGRYVHSHQSNPDSNIKQHEARNHAPRERAIFKEWVEKNMNNISHQAMIDYYYKKTGHKTLYQKYKSLEWDKPSHTIVAHLSKDGYMFIHPDPQQQRSITIREAACLMTFPMDYLFLGSTQYNYKMIGNAVPVNFAKAIATAIYKYLDKNKN